MTTNDPQPVPPKDPWLRQDGSDYWTIGTDDILEYRREKEKFLEELDNWERRNNLR